MNETLRCLEARIIARKLIKSGFHCIRKSVGLGAEKFEKWNFGEEVKRALLRRVFIPEQRSYHAHSIRAFEDLT